MGDDPIGSVFECDACGGSRRVGSPHWCVGTPPPPKGYIYPHVIPLTNAAVAREAIDTALTERDEWKRRAEAAEGEAVLWRALVALVDAAPAEWANLSLDGQPAQFASENRYTAAIQIDGVRCTHQGATLGRAVARLARAVAGWRGIAIPEALTGVGAPETPQEAESGSEAVTGTPEASAWVPTTSRLPEPGRDVLVYAPGTLPVVTVARWDEREVMWWPAGSIVALLGHQVKLWAELPPLPEGE